MNVILLWFQRKKRFKIVFLQKNKMQLTQINIYPVKSLDGYSPEMAIVEKRGLQHDRRWMIVGTDGVFFTQRFHHSMAQLKAQILDSQLFIINKNNQKLISVGIDEYTKKTIKVNVWDDHLEANFVSDAVDAWLSDFLETPCHLVRMPDDAERRVEEDHNTGNDTVSFADGYPYLIIGEASINDLNSRLADPMNAPDEALIGLRRFRANFIFSGGKPYEEESWNHFQIGNVDFRGLKPCGRCVMTTLDPDTGESLGKEPLATLSTYRKVGRKIPFGQNVIWNSAHWRLKMQPTIKVGDKVLQKSMQDNG
jgi:uncharacterized protein YcbX